MDIKQELLVKLGRRIREVRTSKKLSQTQLATLVNKDQQSIQRLEAGNINPSYIYLMEISKGLDVEIAELLRF